MDREVVDLYLDDIIPNRFQPREVFNEEALRELADSIKAHGVIQPIIVRKIGDKYEIIAGERRYKASAMAGLTKIPAIIRNLDDKETSKVALLENLQRKDLTPIEEARTYQKIIELDDMTQEELGRTMGKSQASIANKMRLLSLPDEVQEALLEDKISERHARSLLNLKNPEEQIAMLQEIIDKRMTVRELDARIKGVPPQRYISDPSNQMENQIGLGEENLEIGNNGNEMSQSQPITKMTDFSSDPTNSYHFEHNMDLEKPENSIENLRGEIDSQSIIELKPKIPVEETKPNNLTGPVGNSSGQKRPTIEELLGDEELFSLRDAVSTIRKSAESVRNKGFVIKIEEMDFEKSYQIVVKIDKDI